MPQPVKSLGILLLSLVSLATFSCRDDEAAQAARQALLVAHVEEGHVQSRIGPRDLAFDSWIFLSDAEGNIIGEPKQIQDNSTLEWEKPQAYEGETFYLNWFEYRKVQGNTEISNLYKINTFAHFSLHEIYLLDNSASEVPAPAGEINVTVENDTDGSKNFIYRLDFPLSYDALASRENSIILNTTLQNNQEHGLLSYEFSNPNDLVKGREKYYQWLEFTAGQDYQVNTNGFTPMSSQEVNIDFPFQQGDPFQQGQLFTWGHLFDEEENTIPTDGIVFSPGHNSLTAFYADDIFREVSSLYLLQQSHRTAIGLKKGKITNISLPDFSASVINHDIRNIEIRTSGSFDYLSASWDYMNNFGEEPSNFSRFLYTNSQESATHILPYVPQMLVDQYEVLGMPVYYTRNMEVTDYDAANSYEDILKAWYSDREQRPKLYDFSTLSYFDNSEGGRYAAPPEDIKQEKFNPQKYLKPRF